MQPGWVLNWQKETDVLTYSDCFNALAGRRISDWDIPIAEAVIDSRRVIPGCLFIALPGERTNGNEYIPEAFTRGARIVITQMKPNETIPVVEVDKLQNGESHALPQTPFCLLVPNSLDALQRLGRYRREQLCAQVIGITGSVGKSSTKEMTAEVLGYRFRTYKNPGNYNNEIGLPLTLINAGKGVEVLILEMGFYTRGEIAFLCDIAKPHIGILTNIGTVHAERSGSRESIAAGKAELVEALPSAPMGTAILNYDDDLVRSMNTKTKANVLFYGLNSEADLWADNITGFGLKGIRFNLHYKGESRVINASMIGRHSVSTALRACAAAFTLGMSWSETAHALESSSNQLRMVAVRTAHGALLIDDTYNATPESTIAALDLLNDMSGRKIAVLGDMLELGQYVQSGHEEVGERAARVVDKLLTVGKLGKVIAESALQHGLSSGKVDWVENTQAAVNALKEELQQGDIVLIKGSHGLRMDRIAAALEEVK